MQDAQSDEPGGSGPPHSKPTDPSRDHDHRPSERPNADEVDADENDEGGSGHSGTPAMNPDVDMPPPRDPGEDALANRDNEALLKTSRPPLGN